MDKKVKKLFHFRGERSSNPKEKKTEISTNKKVYKIRTKNKKSVVSVLEKETMVFSEGTEV